MKNDTHTLSKSIPKQTGIVIIFFVIALPFLLTMMALALDTGNLFIVKTELQNAVDACALSAGQELDGTAAQFNRAQEAGRLAGVAHKVNLQTVAVAIPNDSAVTFAPTLNGSYINASTGSGLSGANAATYKFVKCTANSTTNKLITVPTLADSDTITAQAIASPVPAQSPCAIPVGICSTALAVTTNGVGQMITGRASGSPTCVGNTNCFTWTTYNGVAANSNNLTALLKDNNTCNINLSSQVVTEFSGGQVASLKAYNMRFGLQHSSITNAEFKPDFTGWEYTAGNNNYADYLVKKSNFATYQNGVPGGYSQPALNIANVTNRRIGIAPIVPCTGGSTTLNSPNQWACVLLLNHVDGPSDVIRLEYLGRANAGACTQTGYAGGGGGTGPTVAALVQ